MPDEDLLREVRDLLREQREATKEMLVLNRNQSEQLGLNNRLMQALAEYLGGDKALPQGRPEDALMQKQGHA